MTKISKDSQDRIMKRCIEIVLDKLPFSATFTFSLERKNLAITVFYKKFKNKDMLYRQMFLAKHFCEHAIEIMKSHKYSFEGFVDIQECIDLNSRDDSYGYW